MTSLPSVDDLGMAAVSRSDLPLEHIERIAATLDVDHRLGQGTPLPLLWHWAFFTPTVASSNLGHDGHPRIPSTSPLAGYPRRMWAAGRVEVLAPLRIGEPAVRRSRITDVEHKVGRTGRFLLLCLEHRIEQAGEVRIVETQDLIYRGEAPVPLGPPRDEKVRTAPVDGWSDTVTIDPARLHRFSAITFNSHRIHYDEPYATSQEGYPALVVHGPLTALLLLGSANIRAVEGRAFAFRATAPLFSGLPFHLTGVQGNSGADLRAIRNDGVVAMTATLS